MKALAAVALCMAAHTGVAQQLRGTVRDSASGAPIAGAVLVLLDSAGGLIARNITNEQGRYVVTLVSRMRQVQFLRIGFRPRIAPIPAPIDGVARLDVAMVSIPTFLNPVTVIDQPNCPRRRDAAEALALWEQAKTGLLATIVAREANPADMVRLHFDRRMAGNSNTPAHLEVRIDSAATARPFSAARPAAAFVQSGFVDDSAGAKVYNAPDAGVLLDDAFTAGYCFSLAAADPARRNEVGLSFKAAKSKRGRVDIDGVVWIDSVRRSLTDIVYRYVGLDYRFDDYHPGGRISFRPMENGSVIIDRWFIRLVSAGALPLGRSLEVHEKGGEVARAKWPDGREWVASLGAVEGNAWHGAEPAVNTRLRLLDTDYGATTNSIGAFRIPYLLPGPYTVAVVDSILADIGLTLRTGTTFATVRDSTSVLSFVAPTANDYVAAACEAMRQGGAGVFSLVGRVVDAEGKNVRGALFNAREFRGLDFEPLVAGLTDEQGVFVLCSVKRDVLLELTARNKTSIGSALRTVTQRIETITLRLKPSTDAGRPFHQ